MEIVIYNIGRQYLAGCNAIAVAQVMRYWQYPTSYDWANMPDGYPDPVTGIAPSNQSMINLIALLASANYLDEDFGCKATNAKPANISRSFTNLGYPAPFYSLNNYSPGIVSGNLQQGWPIILAGWPSTQWGFFPSGDGHTWVCDGLKQWYYYSCQPDPNTPGEWISQFDGYDMSLHMNWGWFGGQYNGFYSANNFSVANGDHFNQFRSMVTSIHR